MNIGKLAAGTMLLIILIAAPNRTAHAQFTTIEAPGPLLTATIATAGNQTVQTTIMQALNGLAWTVAKTAVQSITRSTVNWINSGFNGSPAFVSDLNQNLSNLSDTVANDFFNHLNQTAVQTTGFNLTSPFQDQITQQLRQAYYQTTSNTLGLSGYDLNGHSTDPQAFLNGDFSKGGFNAFFSASQNPANNPFGAYQLASNALWSQINAAAQQRKTELDWGKGFLPWRGNCTSATTGTAVSLSKSEQCVGSPVKTPGSVIESQLENTLGSGVRELDLADSINEVVGALMGQLVNQVLGPGGLIGVSKPSSGGGSSYINQATSASQNDALNTSLANGVIQNLQSNQAVATTFRDEWQKVLTAAQVAQGKCGVQPNIVTTITSSTAGVQKGNAALQKIASVQAEVQAAAQSTAANKSTQITTAIADYQSYLGSSVALTADEQAVAASQSSDTSSDSTAPQSMYTQMTNLQKSCHLST